MGIRERLAAGAKRVKDRATNQRTNEAERQVERKAGAEPQTRERLDGSDVDHSKVSPESDEEDEMFRRAEDAATMGAPVEATIDPVTEPQEIEKLARGKGGAGDDPDDLELFGGSGDDDGGLFDFGSTSDLDPNDSDGGFFNFGSSSSSESGGEDSNPLEVDDDLGAAMGGDDEP